MRRKLIKLPIDTTVWIVEEHYYYTPDHAGAQKEYRVYEATVRRYIQGGYLEVCLAYKEVEGYEKLTFRRFSGMGSGIYSTPQEAAIVAQILTDAYDKAWAFLHYEPMRRTWEEYLK